MQQISTFCHFLQGGINIFMFSYNQMLCFEMILPIFYLQLFHVEQKLLPVLSYYHISICSNFFIGELLPSMTNFFTAMREKIYCHPSRWSRHMPCGVAGFIAVVLFINKKAEKGLFFSASLRLYKRLLANLWRFCIIQSPAVPAAVCRCVSVGQ